MVSVLPEEGGRVAAPYCLEVGPGQVCRAQGTDRVLGAHVEGEVRTEQDPVRAGDAHQLPQHVRVVDEGVEVQPGQVAAGRVRAAGARVGAGRPGVVGAADVGGQVAAAVGREHLEARVAVQD